ncbi:unnamed protein product [Adineta ricciae]|uniref:Equilibrative nucleoside transporter 1 n=1 Tax=Adineta ricciae TaxID=249248 RepID=A0A816AD86_ADIRI|nr:unnamed protein product [Adineta ricciae]CAF1594467.1 unnamed protein product [Adineta ricciae]
MDSSLHSPREPSTSVPTVVTIDGHSWAYWAFVWLGLGSLLPINFFITADQYFRYKLHDPSMPNSTASRLELAYENAVTLSTSLPNLVTTMLVTFVCVPFIHKYRIYTSLSGITICLLICFSLIFVDVHQWREIFFMITMILVMFQGVLSAILLNCFFSLTSTLPSQYIQGFVAGQALGGVFVVICSIASILFSSDISTSAAIYFLLAIFVFLSNIVTYFYLERSHLLQVYSSSVQQINNENEPLLRSTSIDDPTDTIDMTTLALRQRLLVAYKYTKWNFFGVLLTFICTLSLFPAYMSKIQPAHPTTDYPNTIWSERLYAQVMTFLLFNVGDTLGRMISSKVHVPSLLHPRLLFCLSALRFVFIPLFGFCHFPNTNGYPYIFKNDFIYGFIVLSFATSHGYCNSLNMMFAPKRVHAQLSSTVGALMLMALTLGIFLGSVLSYGVVAMYGDAKAPDNEYFQ